MLSAFHTWTNYKMTLLRLKNEFRGFGFWGIGLTGELGAGAWVPERNLTHPPDKSRRRNAMALPSHPPISAATRRRHLILLLLVVVVKEGQEDLAADVVEQLLGRCSGRRRQHPQVDFPWSSLKLSASPLRRLARLASSARTAVVVTRGSPLAWFFGESEDATYTMAFFHLFRCLFLCGHAGWWGWWIVVLFCLKFWRPIYDEQIILLLRSPRAGPTSIALKIQASFYYWSTCETQGINGTVAISLVSESNSFPCSITHQNSTTRVL